jgi:serine/threonine protein kinase
VSALPLQRIEGKYEILGKIREGGMGAIYKVRHRLLNEIRVIKLMRPVLAEDRELNAELKARFVREAQVAIKLRHPNIAQLYDFTTDEDGTSLIVMEFIRGKTLEELLKTAGPPSLGLALEIARQSLRALGYLHAQGFVHRDISPDNLMLAEDAGEPRIKLIDLGIAKVLGDGDSRLTRTGTFLGKVRYAAPEQFAGGAASTGARGDLYSFGVVLYELLTGIYPINGSDSGSIIAGHLFHRPIGFEDSDRQGRVPLGLRSAVLKALAKQPEERHANAEELARELERFRVPADVPAEEWKQLLEIPAREGVSPVEPGTTQDLLDERLGAEPTPAPTLAYGARRNLPGAEPVAPGDATVQTEIAESPGPRPLEPEQEKERRKNAGGQRPRPAAIAAGMVLLVAALAASAWLLWHSGSREHATGSGADVKRRVVGSAGAERVVPPQQGGALIVDAVPWAEVVEVRDAAGKTTPMPPAAYTPIVLSLPPGRYTIRLRNPAFSRPAVIAAEVPAGGDAQPVRAVAEFRAGDADEFLKEMGW